MAEHLPDVHWVEVVAGTADDVFGVQLHSSGTTKVVTGWMTEAMLAKLHRRIHDTLNLNNDDLDRLGQTYPIGKYH